MNKEYILSKIKPFINSKGMIGEEDFDKLFSRLVKTQQYDVINILIKSNIEIDYDNIKIEEHNPTANQTALSSKSKINKLTNEQLCVIYQQGNKYALEALIVKNNKLIWSRVLKHGRRYKHKLDDEDLVQYGTMGLMKAVSKFDSKKETMFTTYAVWWIDQQILRSIADFGFTIRLPVHYFEQVNSLMRILSQNPDCSKMEIVELAAENRINKDKFEEILMITKNIMSLTSLNSYVGEDEESELGDFVIDYISPNVEEQVEYKILMETVELVRTARTAAMRWNPFKP